MRKRTQGKGEIAHRWNLHYRISQNSGAVTKVTAGLEDLLENRFMSSWGCPHEISGQCNRVKGRPCDPGMKGCTLHGRFVFSNPAKNPVKGPAGKPAARRPEIKSTESR